MYCSTYDGVCPPLIKSLLTYCYLRLTWQKNACSAVWTVNANNNWPYYVCSSSTSEQRQQQAIYGHYTDQYVLAKFLQRFTAHISMLRATRTRWHYNGCKQCTHASMYVGEFHIHRQHLRGFSPTNRRHTCQLVTSFIHSFIHQGRRLAVGSLSTCLSAYRQRWGLDMAQCAIPL